ncbi:MAG: hypothetical protein J5693_07435, partial [Bacteroidales bacterium]|nr:hypothetical protein [Bacteroidales bacterium]
MKRFRHILAVAALALLLASCTAARVFRPVPAASQPADIYAPVYDSIAYPWQLVAVRMSSLGAQAPTTGNSVEVFTGGRSCYAAMLADLEEAEQSIDLEIYRFHDDSIATAVRDVLLRKAAEGVDVHIILETRASNGKKAFYSALRAAPGITVLDVQPKGDVAGSIANMNTWDHRKICVIDGRVGYAGGMNIQDHYYKEWRDTHMRLTGSVVADLLREFDATWTMLDGKAPERRVVDRLSAEAASNPGAHTGVIAQVATDASYTVANPILVGYIQALAGAKDYFYLQTPYFCPPEQFLVALEEAAARRVDVRLMLPAVSDVRIMDWANGSFFKRLLASGVRIYLRGGEFIHSKTAVSDDYFSSIGSANLDNRSLLLNFEDNVYFYD